MHLMLCSAVQGVSAPLFRDWSELQGLNDVLWADSSLQLLTDQAMHGDSHFPWAVCVDFAKSPCSGSHQILLFKSFSTNAWWQVWEPLMYLLSTAQCVHWYLTELLLYFKSVWLNLPSLCLEFVEHQLFYVLCVRTGLLFKSFETLIL